MRGPAIAPKSGESGSFTSLSWKGKIGWLILNASRLFFWGFLTTLPIVGSYEVLTGNYSAVAFLIVSVVLWFCIAFIEASRIQHRLGEME
jgi:hypothetical protein